MSTTEELARKLSEVNVLLEFEDFEEARLALEQADDLSLRLMPHTEEHERFVEEKTTLWERWADRFGERE
jgi:hypothetical protein